MGTRLKGKLRKYTTDYGLLVDNCNERLAEIELPPVNPEELKNGVTRH